jgi:hypothetical protein
VLLAASPWWLRERGGRSAGAGGLGLARDRWLLVTADKEAARLWAVEEALKSGAVAGAIAALEAPSLVATRRLDLSARAGRALGIALRVKPPDDLSAARVRWRVGPAPAPPTRGIRRRPARPGGGWRRRGGGRDRLRNGWWRWMMKRVVSVWLPDWPITRRFGALRTSPPEGPFALVEKTHRGLVIHAANRAARDLGVRLGQTHADARALCPGSTPPPPTSAEDTRGLERLALWCERWSPSVAVDRIGPRLDGADARRHRRRPPLGWRGGVAGRRGGPPAHRRRPARAGAGRHGRRRLGARPLRPARTPRPRGPAEATRAALADLPVEALRLAEPTLVLLKRLGLRRIGQLYALPRAALARRFQGTAKAGEAALQVVRRLDQATASSPKPPRRSAPRPSTASGAPSPSPS